MMLISWPVRAPLALIAAVAVAACASAGAAPAATPAVRGFDPVAFFSGATTGEGRLKKVFSRSVATHVVGRGRVERGGTLVLDQTVTIAGEKTRERQWRLREVAPGRYAGTLTDARGPVTATVAGPVLTIAYTSTDGMGIAQAITLAPNGRSARNVMKVKKLGLTVATLAETITRD
jgi:hypothetical protein